MGEQYYYGKGTEEDKVKGQELIDAVIAQGYMEGYTVSGDIANDEEDYSAAFECYNKALESEEPLFAAIAMSDIADMYWSGKGVEQDYAAAMEWYEKAGVPEKAEAAKKAAASGGGSSNDTGFIPQTYVGPNGTFVANTEEEMFEAMAKAMGAEMVTIEGDGETGGGSLAGLGVGAEVNSQ